MFPFDILEQAFQGNPVAWYCIALGIVMLILLVMMLIVWWKMPQISKSQFWNNLTGGAKPTVAQCHEDKYVRFINPIIHSGGFAYFKGLVYIPLKQWLNGDNEDLSSEIKDIVNSVYSMEGTPSKLYLNYAKSAAIINPEVAAYIQNEKALQKLHESQKVEIDKAKFIAFLQAIPDKRVIIEPLNLNFPISDVRKLKEYMPKSVSKSDFVEFENKIRQDERGDKRGMGSGTILVLLLVILLILNGVGLLKQFGVF